MLLHPGFVELILEYGSIMDVFIQSFIPLFVAMDTLGLVPLFLALTQGIEGKELRKLIYSAAATAFIIAVIFLFTGTALFELLGITAGDFRIGGGILLLVLAIQDLASNGSTRRTPKSDVGIVPIGIPLMMGPAALTTILILVDAHGLGMTMGALVANFVLVLVVLLNSKWVIRIMGEAGSQAFAKVAALFMAGIAVMMIRSGIESALR
ncbi:MAG: MarC family protein [Ignavibacteria bacterium]|nr:MAG: MarC family protein [Ignavibacteria bacterium]